MDIENIDKKYRKYKTKYLMLKAQQQKHQQGRGNSIMSQVVSWLSSFNEDGKTKLVKDKVYRFWQENQNYFSKDNGTKQQLEDDLKSLLLAHGCTTRDACTMFLDKVCIVAKESDEDRTGLFTNGITSEGVIPQLRNQYMYGNYQVYDVPNPSTVITKNKSGHFIKQAPNNNNNDKYWYFVVDDSESDQNELIIVLVSDRNPDTTRTYNTNKYVQPVKIVIDDGVRYQATVVVNNKETNLAHYRTKDGTYYIGPKVNPTLVKIKNLFIRTLSSGEFEHRDRRQEFHFDGLPTITPDVQNRYIIISPATK